MSPWGRPMRTDDVGRDSHWGRGQAGGGMIYICRSLRSGLEGLLEDGFWSHDLDISHMLLLLLYQLNHNLIPIVDDEKFEDRGRSSDEMEFINFYPGDTVSSEYFDDLSFDHNLGLLRETDDDDTPNTFFPAEVAADCPTASSPANITSTAHSSPVDLIASTPASDPPTGVKQVAVKRARRTQACDRCRSRKVRCDANFQKPCSRCLRDHLDCVVRPHARGYVIPNQRDSGYSLRVTVWLN